MEDVILQRMRQFIGWDDGDGIFAPGKKINLKRWGVVGGMI